MKTANLIISCPDRPGIVKTVTEFLFKHRTNISYLEEHVEDNHFFMRIEWQILDSDLKDHEIFNKAFQEIQKEFQMETKLDFHHQKKLLGLFCSRELHCLADILSRVEIGELNVQIPFIISNAENAQTLAEKFNIPFYHIPATGNYEAQQLEIVHQHQVDIIGLARYMKVLSPEFIEKIGTDNIVNVHHSFLPSFIGAKPYEEAYLRGVKLIGATAHYVISKLDQGPIIEQTVKRIDHRFNVENLKLLGRESEKEVFATAIKKHLENKLIIYKNRVVVFS